MCKQHQPVRSLRSSEHSLLCTRRHWGDRAFSVAAPSLWNALLQHLTLSSMTTAAFKVKLKTYLFTRTLCTALWATNVGTALYKCDDYGYYGQAGCTHGRPSSPLLFTLSLTLLLCCLLLGDSGRLGGGGEGRGAMGHRGLGVTALGLAGAF